MTEIKQRQFILELSDKETKAFIDKCTQDGTTPAEVLEGFICDLTGAERTRGSDERMFARQYYDRCGYGMFFTDEYHTFTQWLLNSFEFENLAAILDDKKTLEEEVTFLTKHPEKADEGEIESLNNDIADCNKQIAEIYKEYQEATNKPDTLEEGLKGVIDYLAYIERIKEGGTI